MAPRVGSGRVAALATPVMINVMEAAALTIRCDSCCTTYVAYRHISDLAQCLTRVRCADNSGHRYSIWLRMAARGAEPPFAGMSVVGLNNGKHMLALRFSAFDKYATLGGRGVC